MSDTFSKETLLMMSCIHHTYPPPNYLNYYTEPYLLQLSFLITAPKIQVPNKYLYSKETNKSTISF